MSWAIVKSRASVGIESPPVNVEVFLSKGLPGFRVVGLPEKAVNESKDRVRCAILNCGFQFPAKRIVVNLAPADLPKEGGRFDLPMAIGILMASKQLPNQSLDNLELAGELELSGRLRAIKGMLPFAISAHENNHGLIIPEQNKEETRLLPKTVVYPASHLIEVCEHLKGSKLIEPITRKAMNKSRPVYPDMREVKGQPFARRALEIAAAGSHSLLLTGPPGAGKTLLASRLPGILPAMSESEALEVSTLYSLSSHDIDFKAWGRRPFRSPHHTSSARALVGGGNPPQPGEISLAHRGVLFLDEFPEFERQAIEALREPLESGKISISRAGHQMEFPASFQLIAAMNPCPCGYAGEDDDRCRCTAEKILKYQSKLSGPILDRIDMHVHVSPVSNILLFESHSEVESSEPILKRVSLAREQQYQRSGKTNAWLSSSEIIQECRWRTADRTFFTKAVDQFKLSARAYHRLLKLARTIADLDKAERVEKKHLEEALCFRTLTV